MKEKKQEERISQEELQKTVQEPNDMDFRLNGGVSIENKNGETVLWFKGKDPKPGEDGYSFVLFGFWPEKADPEMRKELIAKLPGLMEISRNLGLPVFNVDELNTMIVGQNKLFPGRTEFNVWVTDIITGEKHELTLIMHGNECAEA